jgi:hypothetical protein
MAQLFRPSSNTIAKVSIVAVVALAMSTLGVAYMADRGSWTTSVRDAPEQPIPFSHKHHVKDDGIDCRYCHSSVETSHFAGLPPTETCMTCHSQLWTNAGMLAPVRASLAKDEPIAWQRVNKLPDYVYFDHSIHVAKGVGCTSCHGAVDQMPLMRQAAPLTMQWCIDCHRAPEKALRPREAVFDTGWSPAKNQEQLGRELMAKYHIRVDHLTDCSVCHR